jgi:ABC-type transport system involved in cytochrome c biogenesis ATPase subunit
MAEKTLLYQHLEYIYYTIGLICPAVSLLRALLVSMNIYALSCNGDQLSSNGGAMHLYGGPILYLILQFLVLVLLLIFYESGGSLEAFGIHLGKKKAAHKDHEKDVESSDNESAEDVQRLSSTNNGLRVQHLSRTFGRNKAVDDVSFGILPSEKFALLGPNGAGKSTSISLIRGELRPDSSLRTEIHISGDSLLNTPVAAKQHLGVCPQFDSVDSMTLSEHLHFYARARGVYGKEKEDNVREIISRLGLSDHKNKLVKKVSPWQDHMELTTLLTDTSSPAEPNANSHSESPSSQTRPCCSSTSLQAVWMLRRKGLSGQHSARFPPDAVYLSPLIAWKRLMHCVTEPESWLAKC